MFPWFIREPNTVSNAPVLHICELNPAGTNLLTCLIYPSIIIRCQVVFEWTCTITCDSRPIASANGQRFGWSFLAKPIPFANLPIINKQTKNSYTLDVPKKETVPNPCLLLVTLITHAYNNNNASNIQQCKTMAICKGTEYRRICDDGSGGTGGYKIFLEIGRASCRERV